MPALMPLYGYRCSCGREFDEFARFGSHHTAPCPDCGEDAKYVFPTVRYNGARTHTSWSDIAPVDSEGRTMSTKEAAKAGVVDTYNPDSQYRDEAHRRSLAEDRERVIKERSKREAWDELSKKRRIVV